MIALIRRIAAGWLSSPRAAIALIALIALFFICTAISIGLRWDPFDLQGRRLARVQDEAARALSDAAARTLEVEGERRQARRVQDHADILIATDRATARVVAQTRDDHDLVLPLDRARADRLRTHDGELCRLAPDLAGCAATAGASGGGDPPLRPRDPG